MLRRKFLERETLLVNFVTLKIWNLCIIGNITPADTNNNLHYTLSPVTKFTPGLGPCP
jgi:hypothetical protein